MSADLLSSRLVVHRRGRVVEAVGALCDGLSVRRTARDMATSRALIQAWRRGLGLRMLDLVELLRHRALVASQGAPASARLVRFAQFRIEASTGL